MFDGKPIVVARYGVPGAVLGMALAWLAVARGPVVQAQLTGPNGEPSLIRPESAGQPPAGPQVPIGQPSVVRTMPMAPGYDPAAGRKAPRVAASGESSGTITLVVPSNDGTAQWLYIVDTKTHQLAIYKVDTAAPKASIKLEVAREYGWDLKINQYNNSGLEPAAIEKLVKSVVQQARQ